MMKKIFAVSLMLLLCLNLFAQSDNADNTKRSKAGNLFMVAPKDDSSSGRRVFTQKHFTHWKEISLRSFDPEKLNDIERDLLNRYYDVVITQVFKAYITFDEAGNIGVCSLDGIEIVPPIKGKFRSGVNPGTLMFVLGDESEDMDDFNNVVDISNKNAATKVAYPLGLFKCVLKFNSKGVEEIIPYGKYDYASIVLGNMSAKGFYVCKIDENHRENWGFCDKQGREIIECKYRSISYEGKEFAGDDRYTMAELIAKYDLAIKLKEEQRRQRIEMWSSILDMVGNTAVGIGVAMQQAEAGSNAASDVSSSSKSSSSKSSSSGVHPGMSQSQLQQRYNSAIQNIRNLRDSWYKHVGTSTEVSNQNNLREIKANIQSIKKSAAEHGITLQTDPLENWNP